MINAPSSDFTLLLLSQTLLVSDKFNLKQILQAAKDAVAWLEGTDKKLSSVALVSLLNVRNKTINVKTGKTLQIFM